MFGSGYLKGLLVKGLKSMTEAQQLNKPIANLLKESEAMVAFTEFWKEVIED